MTTCLAEQNHLCNLVEGIKRNNSAKFLRVSLVKVIALSRFL